MGGLLNSCFQFATRVNDWYVQRHWDDENSIYLASLSSYQESKPSLFSAIIDKDIDAVDKVFRNLKEQNLTEETKLGETALHLACRLGHLEIIDGLLRNQFPMTYTKVGSPIHCLVQAFSANYVKCSDVLITLDKLTAYGCNVNAVDFSGKTALHFACNSANIACIQKLIALGADVNLANNHSVTPLHHCCSTGQLLAVNCLLKNSSINVNAVDNCGRSALLTLLTTVELHIPTSILAVTGDEHLDNYCEKIMQKYLNQLAIIEVLLKAGNNPFVTVLIIILCKLMYKHTRIQAHLWCMK